MAALACEEHPQLCVRAKLQASVSPLSASETLIFMFQLPNQGAKNITLLCTHCGGTFLNNVSKRSMIYSVFLSLPITLLLPFLSVSL